MDEFVEIPLYYVLSRSLPREEADAVMQVLHITPVRVAIVSDLLDTDLAWMFAPEVLRSDTDENALALARQLALDTRTAILVIGKADFLDAVYVSGKRKAMAKHA